MTGVIQQGKDPRVVLVDLGKIEAVLPPQRAGPGRGIRARRAHPLPTWSQVKKGHKGPPVTLVAHPPRTW